MTVQEVFSARKVSEGAMEVLWTSPAAQRPPCGRAGSELTRGGLPVDFGGHFAAAKI